MYIRCTIVIFFSLHYFSHLRAVCLFFLIKWALHQHGVATLESLAENNSQISKYSPFANNIFFSLCHTELRDSEGPTNQVYPGCFYCRLS